MNNACDTPACASAQADTGKPKKCPKVHKFFVDLLMAARHLGYLFQVAVLCSSTV